MASRKTHHTTALLLRGSFEGIIRALERVKPVNGDIDPHVAIAISEARKGYVDAQEWLTGHRT